jgi:hypothetical protein
MMRSSNPFEVKTCGKRGVGQGRRGAKGGGGHLNNFCGGRERHVGESEGSVSFLLVIGRHDAPHQHRDPATLADLVTEVLPPTIRRRSRQEGRGTSFRAKLPTAMAENWACLSCVPEVRFKKNGMHL